MTTPASSASSAEPAQSVSYVREHRLQKLQALADAGINPYPYAFKRTHTHDELQTQYQSLENATETQDQVQVAGRILALRNSGLFLDVHDPTGKLQYFCHKESLDEAGLKLLPLLDIGDHVGVSGTIRRTPRGELSVRVKELTLLSKSLQPLPEKYHGLTDTEIRYRQRYLDLIVNEESRHTLRQRSKIVSHLRRMLEDEGFMEVETPMLHPLAGGASARPFVTHHNSLDCDLYLRIAPELYLKRLVVGGLWDKVFEINRCFRNEGIDTRHNPEFTSIEVYQAYVDYTEIMTLTEKLMAGCAQTVCGATSLPFGEHTLNFAGPWPRKTMLELVKEAAGVDFMALETAEAARAGAEAAGVSVDPKSNWGQTVEAVFAEKVEHTLIQPTIVTDLPKDISPLAKVHRQNPRLAERFEVYINGWEVATAFSELSDPLDQRARFEEQVAQREAGDSEAQPMDEDYCTALEVGLPPTGGLGIGVDRLVMLLTNSPSIRDVIAFPTLRPRG